MAESFPKRLIIVQRQMEQLRGLFDSILPQNKFYAAKLAAAEATRRISHLGHFSERIPLTNKAELAADQLANPPFGTNLTFPLNRYSRCHQTSGTSGTPLRWLDTPESWDWMVRGWQEILRVAGVTRDDRILFAFSFGPFIAFWLAFEAAGRLGSLTLPGGGLSTSTRLRLIMDYGATVVCCTPTYAVRLAEVAAEEKIDLQNSPVRLLMVAGEAGGSILATRQRLEQLWPGARVFDHHGMTEVGPVSHECPLRPGVLHVMEQNYVAEVIDTTTGAPTPSGSTGELILTPLGRIGSPLLRYRTGDVVRAPYGEVCVCGRSDIALEGGILGRTDDMVVVRGVNVYPSAIEEIIRRAGGIAEYRVRVRHTHALTEIEVQIEPEAGVTDSAGLTQALERSFEAALSLRVPVTATTPGTLERFESKAKRWLKE